MQAAKHPELTKTFLFQNITVLSHNIIKRRVIVIHSKLVDIESMPKWNLI